MYAVLFTQFLFGLVISTSCQICYPRFFRQQVDNFKFCQVDQNYRDYGVKLQSNQDNFNQKGVEQFWKNFNSLIVGRVMSGLLLVQAALNVPFILKDSMLPNKVIEIYIEIFI
eukprot:TRINITY_DN16945_c0_g1_i4.p5 TRINITY_DN16945_c0_g1~~TRINITY_DN16945_c0_g1_i4.p5  ORF type:complete len:113 (+),score=1.22 TRINITY_DN16945_c0_g1_i4:450-788(+)